MAPAPALLMIEGAGVPAASDRCAHDVGGASTAQLAITLRLAEPPATVHADPIGRQLHLCARYLRHRFIGWIFFYGVLLVALEHVAYTLMRPWLTEVLGRSPDDVGATPLFAGIVYAAVAAVGTLAARASAPLATRFGTMATLLGFGALSAAIVTGMALWVHAAVLALVAFRSAQGAAAPALILLVISADAGDDVQRVLAVFSVASWAMVAVLVVTAWWAFGLRHPSPAA